MTPSRFVNLLVLSALSVFLAACGGGHKAPITTPTFAASSFSGAYAFSASGTDPADGDYFVAGSIIADGKGGVTGIEDLNLGSGIDSNVPLSGTYTVDGAGFVSVTLSDGSGIPTLFTFSIVAATPPPTRSSATTGRVAARCRPRTQMDSATWVPSRSR